MKIMTNEVMKNCEKRILKIFFLKIFLVSKLIER